MGYTSVGVSQGVLYLRFTSQGVIPQVYLSGGYIPGLLLRWVYTRVNLSGVYTSGLPLGCVYLRFISQVGILVVYTSQVGILVVIPLRCVYFRFSVYNGVYTSVSVCTTVVYTSPAPYGGYTPLLLPMVVIPVLLSWWVIPVLLSWWVFLPPAYGGYSSLLPMVGIPAFITRVVYSAFITRGGLFPFHCPGVFPGSWAQGVRVGDHDAQSGVPLSLCRC